MTLHPFVALIRRLEKDKIPIRGAAAIWAGSLFDIDVAERFEVANLPLNSLVGDAQPPTDGSKAGEAVIVLVGVTAQCRQNPEGRIGESHVIDSPFGYLGKNEFRLVAHGAGPVSRHAPCGVGMA